MTRFLLPSPIKELLRARNQVKSHYQEILLQQNSQAELRFTLDGNLIGDIGEAIAVELFGIKLVHRKAAEGIDGYAPDGKTSVQIKATGTGRGPVFRNTKIRADHLLFFDLDFDRMEGTVIYNGPEHYALSLLPSDFSGQRMITRKQIVTANECVLSKERLPRRPQPTTQRTTEA